MADGKNVREARLAAALRENLKRRKAAASPAGETAAGTVPPQRGAATDGAKAQRIDGAAEGPPDEDR